MEFTVQYPAAHHVLRQAAMDSRERATEVEKQIARLRERLSDAERDLAELGKAAADYEAAADALEREEAHKSAVLMPQKRGQTSGPKYPDAA